MILSVDRFSEIQEAAGIAGADDLLKKVAARLAGAVEAGSFVARLGDDSFAIVIPRADSERAHELAKHIQGAMTDPFELAGVPLDVRTTSGIALFPTHGGDADALIRRSDIAVRRARAAGIEYALYSGRSETETPQRLILLAELRKAIKDDELLLYYQPKIDVRAGAVSAVEALVRWPHAERGMVPPKDFIPAAEQTGLIKPLTDWVLAAAWKQVNHWHRLGIDIPVAVNVSPNILRGPDLLKQLICTGYPGRRPIGTPSAGGDRVGADGGPAAVARHPFPGSRSWNSGLPRRFRNGLFVVELHRGPSHSRGQDRQIFHHSHDAARASSGRCHRGNLAGPLAWHESRRRGRRNRRSGESRDRAGM